MALTPLGIDAHNHLQLPFRHGLLFVYKNTRIWVLISLHHHMSCWIQGRGREASLSWFQLSLFSYSFRGKLAKILGIQSWCLLWWFLDLPLNWIGIYTYIDGLIRHGHKSLGCCFTFHDICRIHSYSKDFWKKTTSPNNITRQYQPGLPS